MTSNSLTQYEEHDIPSQILKTILGYMRQLYVISFRFLCWYDPKLIMYIIPLE